ncbi:hypothetical protein N7524_003370 [Penicillium chrysogenum]|nr:hypothetical protein N7524_003370 [Penicillium chrysogenum]
MGSRHEINSSAVRKRIENHDFNDEEGEEYEASSFGGFGDYMRRKKMKLQNLDAEIRAATDDCPPIFRGVVAHVNGYTQPSLQDLHRLIVSHGGGFLQYLDGKTAATHIIASALTPKKREEFRRYRIVKPTWVTDSIEAGRLLPWDEFRLVDEGQAQRVLKFDDGRFISQTNSPRLGYKDQSRSSWYSSQLRDMSRNKERLGSPSKPVTPSMRSKTPPMVTPTMPSQASQSDYGDFPSFTMEKEDEAHGPQHQQETPASDVAQTTMPQQIPNSDQVPISPDPLVDLGPTSLLDQTSATNPVLTSEEYNARLLSDPRMQKSSAANPEFLQQFYRESRLHHLSTWKAELKAQLQVATKENAQSQRSKKKPAPGSRRYILHVDFDSFFAAVSVLNHPELQDKPVAIAHGPGSGSEIASCNYPARARGVKNGMWMKGALQLCPDLKVLPYDFPAYEDASRKFYSSILAIDGTVQSVSIDEALIDITNLCLEAGGSDGKAISEGSIYREQAKADEIAQDLRDSIKKKTGCAVSVGIGNNILLAKVSLRRAKPAGQFQLKPDAVLDFIGDLTVCDLPGVGNSMAIKLEELNVKFVKDIRDLSKERLISHLGPKTGIKLWEYARGIDRTEVGDQTMRKSVSAEVNWGIRFVNQDQADDFVRSLCEELNRRLTENLVKGKQLTLKVMRRSMDAPLEPVKHLGHGKCDTFNKSVALGVATNVAETIGKEAISMLKSFNFSPGDLRGLGGPESSQRQLNFQKSPSHKKIIPDADPDELESPQKGDSVRIQADPVLSDSAHKPLNISGSQFIMPTQADPQILAELPTDIRSRLVAQGKPRQDSRSGSPCPPPREARRPTQADLPPQSQLDPDALAALPEDVRQEVLGYYNSPATNPPHAPAVPESRPSTSSSLKLRRPLSPPKKRRGRPPKSATIANKPKPKPLSQSNFGFALPRPAAVSASLDEEALSRQSSPNIEEPAEASAEFLAALPEDIRQELLEEQRRSRMQQQSRAPEPAQRPPSRAQEAPPAPITVEKPLPLPPLPKRPVFTSQRLSQLPDLRDAVGSWHEAFAADGPYSEDVTSLCKYLSSVTMQEKDVDKAVSVVSWLMWLVDDHSQQQVSKEPPGSRPEGTISWKEAIETMQYSIQVALEQRDLPPVDFSAHQTTQAIGMKPQLLHYGLPPSKVKATAKMRLLKAVQDGSLTVPKESLQIEKNLKKEWKKQDSEEQPQTNTKTTTTKTVTTKTVTVSKTVASKSTESKTTASKTAAKPAATKAAASKKDTASNVAPKATAAKTAAAKPAVKPTTTKAVPKAAAKPAAVKAAAKTAAAKPATPKAAPKKATAPKAATAKATPAKRKRTSNDEETPNKLQTAKRRVCAKKAQRDTDVPTNSHPEPSGWSEQPEYEDAPPSYEFACRMDGEHPYDALDDQMDIDYDGESSDPPSPPRTLKNTLGLLNGTYKVRSSDIENGWPDAMPY